MKEGSRPEKKGEWLKEGNVYFFPMMKACSKSALNRRTYRYGILLDILRSHLVLKLATYTIAPDMILIEIWMIAATAREALVEPAIVNRSRP